MKKVCLAIGVSRAEGLDHLPGALTAAEGIADWARKTGYDDVDLVTDRDGSPVTIARVRSALDRLLRDDGLGIDTFVLHFAGHGFRIGAEQNLWLPNDWDSQLRAISVEGLRSKLSRHGIKNLTIFSDACRSLPSSVEILEITPDSVLGKGPYDVAPPILDRFNAVMDGQQAFMVPGETDDEARCVFSTAVLEAICGHRLDAFDQHMANDVTPESLDLFLRKRLQEIANRYGMRCRPENVPGTPRDHLIYFRRGNAAVQTQPPSWPLPPWEKPAYVPSPPLQNSFPGKAADALLRSELAKINPSLDAVQFKLRLDLAEYGVISDLVLASEWVESASDGYERKYADIGLSKARQNLRQRVTINATIDRTARLFGSLSEISEPYELGLSNLLVVGARVTRVWSRLICTRKLAQGPNSVFQLRFFSLGSPKPPGTDHGYADQILVEFDDGLFASAVVYENLTTVVYRDHDGQAIWACYDRNDDRERQLKNTMMAIDGLTWGVAVEAVDQVARGLREAKHINPTLGAIAAYLYDFGGDVDSIRRMASFYAQRRQPMPFDVAYMGLLEIQPRGALVQVPATPARSDPHPHLPEWITQGTPDRTGSVAGHWPWLKQGWDFIEQPEPQEALAAADVADLRHYVLPSAFTSFAAAGGALAIEMFKLGGNQ